MFCSACGSEIQESAAFCSSCGAKNELMKQDSGQQKEAGDNQASAPPPAHESSPLLDDVQVSQLKPGSIISFGRYPQHTSVDETPISWIVLDVNTETMEARLISKNILDCLVYNGSRHESQQENAGVSGWFRKVVTDVIPDSTTWKDSEMRQWMNSDFFFKAFNPDEQRKMIRTKCTGNGADSSDDLPQTEDYVFLLNTDEARMMGGDAQRQADGTEHAKKIKSNGCCLQSHGNENKPRWWLRNRGTGGAGCVAYVQESGNIYAHGHYANERHYGMRPVICIKL